jgi:hypothetical protein
VSNCTPSSTALAPRTGPEARRRYCHPGMDLRSTYVPPAFVFLLKPGELPQFVSSHLPHLSPTSAASFPAFKSTSTSMAATTPTCGWVDLPKCNKRCWFAHLPRRNTSEITSLLWMTLVLTSKSAVTSPSTLWFGKFAPCFILIGRVVQRSTLRGSCSAGSLVTTPRSAQRLPRPWTKTTTSLR